GNVMVALQVDCWNVPCKAEQLTVWSVLVSDITMILGMVPIGMNCACTFTVTGVEELIVASGKLNGLALIGIVTPPTTRLVTLSPLGGAVGGTTMNGADVTRRPATSFDGLARD